MRLVSLKSVIDSVAQLRGFDPASLPASDAAMFCDSITQRTKEAWEFEFWPELLLVERRTYRPAWSGSLTYAAGDIVYFDAGTAAAAYYAANSSPNNPAAGESPATHPAKWTANPAFARAIALDQPGETPMGEVSRVCRRDPRIYPTKPGEVLFEVTELGIMPEPCAGVRPYVEFRTRPPVFSTVAWEQTANYAAGAVRYRPSTGECYECLQASTGNLPESEPAYWRRIGIPAVFEQFVKRAAYADALRGDDQNETALAEEGRAYGFLNRALDQVFASQGQYTQARVVTR